MGKMPTVPSISMMTIGMESWFYNFSQMSRKGNSPETLADVPRPYFEYSLWGLFKGAELGSVIGGLLAHPLYRYYLNRQLTPEKTTPNSSKVIRAQCRKLQGRFLIAGLVIGPVAALLQGIAEGSTLTDLRRKCYAIRCDGESMTMDRCAFVMGFVGWYWKRFQGAVDGINIGLAYAIINNKIMTPYTTPMLKDKVQADERYESVEAAEENRSRLVKFMADLDRNKPVTQ